MVVEEFEYKKGTEHLLEDVPDIGYTKEELDKRDILYTTEEPNKVFVNFFNVKLRYEKCILTFSSKFLLYKYLKLNCLEQN